MEMRFFWVADAVEQGKFNIKYYPGKENLGDYQSKHILVPTIRQYDLGTYTNPQVSVNYPELTSRAL